MRKLRNKKEKKKAVLASWIIKHKGTMAGYPKSICDVDLRNAYASLVVILVNFDESHSCTRACVVGLMCSDDV